MFFKVLSYLSKTNGLSAYLFITIVLVLSFKRTIIISYRLICHRIAISQNPLIFWISISQLLQIVRLLITQHHDGQRGSLYQRTSLQRFRQRQHYNNPRLHFPPKNNDRQKQNDYQVLPVYLGNDDISGRIDIQLTDSYKYDHLGLKCYLIGYLQIYSDSNLSTQFTLLSKELQPAGYLTANKSFKFKFSHFDKEYESFRGNAGSVKYFVRVALARNVIGALVEEEEFAVVIKQNGQQNPLVPTILNVGVDERLHIQFVLEKNSYDIKEWVQGKVKFIVVKMPISKMQISLIRKQTLGTADSTTSQSKVLEKFEVMDGCPDQGDVVPFRMCMRGVKNLTPSYKSIHNRLFVRHWFMVTIYDEQGGRFFKQSQISFYRK